MMYINANLNEKAIFMTANQCLYEAVIIIKQGFLSYQ